MNNNMEKVATMLGVKLGEEFELIFAPNSMCHATVMLTVDGARVIDTNVYDVFNFKAYLLQDLIKGSYGIKRKPWKPKFNEAYYSIGTDGTVEDGTWLNDFLDYSLYKLGNCYRTAEEAKNNRDKWGTFYSSDEVLKI
jgi:hypothetical protein